MIVCKFGGSSLGTPDRIKQAAQLVGDSRKKIVVVSALQGTTDKLIDILDLIKKYRINKAETELFDLKTQYDQLLFDLFTEQKYLDMAGEYIDQCFEYLKNAHPETLTTASENQFVGQGEILSSGLFDFVLKEKNLISDCLSAYKFMRLDKELEPDQYYIRENLNYLMNQFHDRDILVTQGYICRNFYGEPANLGRGGSDFSASLIGAALGATEIQIWTDTDGIQNNDPRVISDTKPIAELSYKEAEEMAYFGAKILHPKSVFPAQVMGIPVRLKNTMNPEAAGTLITNRSRKDKIKAISAKDGIIAIRIRSAHMLMAYGFLKSIFEVFEAFKTPIDMISTSEVSVSLTIDSALYLEPILEKLKSFGEVSFDLDQSIICVVGDFLAEEAGLANKVIQAMQDIPIRMISYGGSNNNISLLVKSADKSKALLCLHEKIFVKQESYV